MHVMRRGCSRSTRSNSYPSSRFLFFFFPLPPRYCASRAALPCSRYGHATRIVVARAQLQASCRLRSTVARILVLIILNIIVVAGCWWSNDTTHFEPTFVRNALSRRETVHARIYASFIINHRPVSDESHFIRVLKFATASEFVATAVLPRMSKYDTYVVDNDVAFHLRISRSNCSLCIIIVTNWYIYRANNRSKARWVTILCVTVV